MINCFPGFPGPFQTDSCASVFLERLYIKTWFQGTTESPRCHAGIFFFSFLNQALFLARCPSQTAALFKPLTALGVSRSILVLRYCEKATPSSYIIAWGTPIRSNSWLPHCGHLEEYWVLLSLAGDGGGTGGGREAGLIKDGGSKNGKASQEWQYDTV